MNDKIVPHAEIEVIYEALQLVIKEWPDTDEKSGTPSLKINGENFDLTKEKVKSLLDNLGTDVIGCLPLEKSRQITTNIHSLLIDLSGTVNQILMVAMKIKTGKMSVQAQELSGATDSFSKEIIKKDEEKFKELIKIKNELPAQILEAVNNLVEKKIEVEF